MNTFVAASLFDSPWVILVIVLVSALSQWLMKRRQRNQADERQDSDEPGPTAGGHEPSQRQFDLQEALRQLLGGEPPVRAPQPWPTPPVRRDAQPAEVEEQFEREETWIHEPQEGHEAARPPAIPTTPPAGAYPALAQANLARTEVSERHKEGARRFVHLDEQGRHPATVVETGRGSRSRAGARTVALLRDSRTVRQAFIASLVFAPSKGWET
jgi:hypothetical protein